MTRYVDQGSTEQTASASVEIPEAAVEAAARAMRPELFSDERGFRQMESLRQMVRDAARTSLLAALPYLAPAEADLVVTKEAHDFLAGWKYNDVRISTDEAIAETMRLMKPGTPPAPAGDGGFSDTGARTASPGLREALERLVTERKSNDGNDLIVFPAELSALLTDHPAAHAVSVDTAKSTASTSAVPLQADELERLHLAASALADLWHVPIDVFWQTREMHLEILRGSAVPQPAGESATKLDCGICYRDDSDPEKIVFTYLAECGNHGRY